MSKPKISQEENLRERERGRCERERERERERRDRAEDLIFFNNVKQ
jgi:hypothetical protein